MDKTRMIIARHGNTFDPDEPPRRVGARTDLELVEKGIIQATQLGSWLVRHDMIPDHIIAGPLRRTHHMAEIARSVIFDEKVEKPHIEIDERLREIDYGPDENLREEEVINRIGADALDLWDKKAIVPEGWEVNPEDIKKHWFEIADDILCHHTGETVLVVTSNGIARFAPHLTGHFDDFREKHTLKLATGAIGILSHQNGKWSVEDWNIRPHKDLE